MPAIRGVLEMEVSVMHKELTDNHKQVWKYRMGDYPKSEKLLKGNL